VRKTVVRALASDDGGLVIEFADGDRLTIAPHTFEPWQFETDDGKSLITSVAGGGLAIWKEIPTDG
jgi:hypothetical protein